MKHWTDHCNTRSAIEQRPNLPERNLPSPNHYTFLPPNIQEDGKISSEFSRH